MNDIWAFAGGSCHILALHKARSVNMHILIRLARARDVQGPVIFIPSSRKKNAKTLIVHKRLLC